MPEIVQTATETEGPVESPATGLVKGPVEGRVEGRAEGVTEPPEPVNDRDGFLDSGRCAEALRAFFSSSGIGSFPLLQTWLFPTWRPVKSQPLYVTRLLHGFSMAVA
jgi:hypothetical protein